MNRFDGFDLADRYKFDLDACHYAKGWAQVDTQQDDDDYGTWANPFKLHVFRYCEGNTTLITFDTKDEFVKYLQNLNQGEQECGHSDVHIDCMCMDNIKQEFISLGLKSMLH